MKFERLEIPDLVLCTPNIFSDDRGYFFESFNQKAFENFIGFEVNFCQDNESKSIKNVLRGLHFQLLPFAQSKLVRVIQGRVLDVAVDIRKGSPYFGKYVAVELNEENKNQLFIPRGFAHGFLAMEKENILVYSCTNYRDANSEISIFWNDKNLNINWPIKKPILSKKDSLALSFDKFFI